MHRENESDLYRQGMKQIRFSMNRQTVYHFASFQINWEHDDLTLTCRPKMGEGNRIRRKVAGTENTIRKS